VTLASVAAIEHELAAKRQEAAGGHAGARAHVVDLVAYSTSRSVADEVHTAVASARHNRPSRALIAVGDAAASEVVAQTEVFADPPSDREGALVCSEVVRLTGPPDSDALATMVASLLVPDLPVFVLWLAAPDFDRPPFAALRTLATRIVTDSIRHPTTLDALPGMIASGQQVVTDLAWTKITGWREILAGLFDLPDHAKLLSKLDHVEVRYVRGSDSQARLFSGWLSSTTGTTPRVTLDPVEHADMRAGSLVEVVLRAGGERFAVERLAQGVAETVSPRLPHMRLALRVPPFEELVAEELEYLTVDEAFVTALEAATDLWG
jgi:glucose-6-phosphate dehydrogenase assembly protein OpcA